MGYSAPLVGGVTVFAWTVPAILSQLGTEWLHHGWIAFDLKRPVYPGLLVNCQVETGTSCERLVLKQINGATEEQCLSGDVGLGAAPWLNEMSACIRADVERKHSRMKLTLGNALAFGIKPMNTELTAARMQQYVQKYARDDNRIWQETAHPGWLAGQMNVLIEESYAHYPAIHIGTKLQYHKRIPLNVTLRFEAKVMPHSRVLSNGRHLIVIDACVYVENELHAQLRHSTLTCLESKL